MSVNVCVAVRETVRLAVALLLGLPVSELVPVAERLTDALPLTEAVPVPDAVRELERVDDSLGLLVLDGEPVCEAVVVPVLVPLMLALPVELGDCDVVPVSRWLREADVLRVPLLLGLPVRVIDWLAVALCDAEDDEVPLGVDDDDGEHAILRPERRIAGHVSSTSNVAPPSIETSGARGSPTFPLGAPPSEFTESYSVTSMDAENAKRK